MPTPRTAAISVTPAVFFVMLLTRLKSKCGSVGRSTKTFPTVFASVDVAQMAMEFQSWPLHMVCWLVVLVSRTSRICPTGRDIGTVSCVRRNGRHSPTTNPGNESSHCERRCWLGGNIKDGHLDLWASGLSCSRFADNAFQNGWLRLVSRFAYK